MPAGETNYVGNMNFSVKIKTTNNFSGIADWCQLNERSVAGIPIQGTFGEYWLDNDPFFQPYQTINLTNSLSFIDNPGIQTMGVIPVSITDKFKTYLMFKPDGSGSIWVTLGLVSWDWSATELWGTTLTSSMVDGPYYIDSDEFPIWYQITHSSPGL